MRASVTGAVMLGLLMGAPLHARAAEQDAPAADLASLSVRPKPPSSDANVQPLSEPLESISYQPKRKAAPEKATESAVPAVTAPPATVPAPSEDSVRPASPTDEPPPAVVPAPVAEESSPPSSDTPPPETPPSAPAESAEHADAPPAAPPAPPPPPPLPANVLRNKAYFESAQDVRRLDKPTDIRDTVREKPEEVRDIRDEVRKGKAQDIRDQRPELRRTP
jgi:hypothetical protein